ncbi:MAG TPA: type ISP restriction/modification enzyme, partial [Thermoanaerobaculia bacterium]|nr:type ISP restriction/modification enzyme [Thermoanaerobaculia bacterium]
MNDRGGGDLVRRPLSRPGPGRAAALRRRHGLYATPPPLVGYLVRSVHRLLQAKLGRPAGLADPEVRLLDLAAGSMPFLRAAWRLALEAHWHQGGEPAEIIRDHLLPHFQSVELLPEAHARGQAALRRFLRAHAHTPDPAAPLPGVLADALAPAQEILDFPANVVLGNPPWRGRSEVRGEWITGLLARYFEVDGKPLGERNSKWLGDDAVRFLRLAQWKIDQAGQGIAALVLPHTGLDAPTFRGLRGSLLDSFDEVYVFDLHGNQRKRERNPRGGADENVFAGIAQGAALFVLVKRPGLSKRVRRADLYGERRAKLAVLATSHVGTTAWTDVEPRAPSYLFVAGDRGIEQEYRRGLSLPEIFPLSSTGVITGCDALAVGVERQLLEERLRGLREAGAPDRRLDPGRWEELRRDPDWSRRIRSFLVRPFDHRFLLYADYFLARPRAAVMAHMEGGDNLALVACRQARGDVAALVTRSVIGHKAVSGYDVSTLFPLYLDQAAPNLAPDLLRRLAERYGAPPSPAAVLGYVYAVLYDPVYRTRYDKLLRADFPRIPFPEEQELFLRRAALGKELIDLHLLADERLRRPPVRLAGAAPGDSIRNRLGSGARTLLDYHPSQGQLSVNPFGLRFEGVAPEVFRYEIGGHAVLPGWLRARAGRVLTAEAAATFCRIAAALGLTLEVQARIAEVG